MTPKLIPATEKDLELIHNLAYEIWNQHYVSIIGQEQVNYMLQKMYDIESLKEQINTKKHQFYLIEFNSKVIGFLSISSDKNSYYFLHKFYILSQSSNLNIGSTVLQILVDIIHPKSITLTVNRQNYKSINFYFKNGFKIKKVEDFDIGNGYQMNDFIMQRDF
ncbi:MAG: GNAT family N-acetyltransferase [Bacteroidia bacterium]|nr:GNAT family N-acetyltransferase [Bacteroidia bacterium]